jgi:hypothetical protein
MGVQQERAYDSEFNKMQCRCQRNPAAQFLKWQKVQQVQLSFVFIKAMRPIHLMI